MDSDLKALLTKFHVRLVSSVPIFNTSSYTICVLVCSQIKDLYNIFLSPIFTSVVKWKFLKYHFPTLAGCYRFSLLPFHLSIDKRYLKKCSLSLIGSPPLYLGKPQFFSTGKML